MRIFPKKREETGCLILDAFFSLTEFFARATIRVEGKIYVYIFRVDVISVQAGKVLRQREVGESDGRKMVEKSSRLSGVSA